MVFKYHSLSKKDVGTSLSEINVTPLVDVMLVLLIIFMVTAPMMQSGIGINLPQAETQTAPAEEGLTLSISSDRYIHIQDQVINQMLLEDTIKNYFMGIENPIVYIRADTVLPYGYVISIIATIKNAGVEKVGLIIDPLSEKDKK